MLLLVAGGGTPRWVLSPQPGCPSDSPPASRGARRPRPTLGVATRVLFAVAAVADDDLPPRDHQVQPLGDVEPHSRRGLGRREAEAAAGRDDGVQV